MEVLAVIPARGGSKSIPKKNIQVVDGQPLIAYTIKAALKSELISRVVVSTDDLEIGTVSQNCGAEVVWRPENISGDRSPSELALLHVIDTLSSREEYR